MTYPCPSRERRAGMTDADFWTDVFPQADEPDDDDLFEQHLTSLPPGDGIPCPECGEVGACAYDAEGRALIHPTNHDHEDGA